MGRVKTAGLGLMLAASLATSARADERITTVPRTGKWVVSFDKDSCRLVGDFGADKNQILIELAEFSPDEKFDLSILGQPVKADNPWAKLKMGFGPAFKPVTVETMNGTQGRFPVRIVSSIGFDNRQDSSTNPDTIPTTPPNRVVRYLDVWADGKTIYRLDLGSMIGPMKVMHSCMDDLVKSWGYDPEAMAADNARAKPKGSPGVWLRSDDYPGDLLRQGAMGIVHFRLDVDEKGAVTGCHVQMSSKPEGFDTVTCKLLSQRAKFTPGHDAKGVSIKSYYVSSARWLIPNY